MRTTCRRCRGPMDEAGDYVAGLCTDCVYEDDEDEEGGGDGEEPAAAVALGP